MKLIKGDNVKVLIGKDKGRTGKIVRTLPKFDQIVVEGLNKFKKHLKPTASGQSGRIIEKERPLKSSKVILICPHCQKPTRISYQLDKSGEKYRLCRKCQSIINHETK